MKPELLDFVVCLRCGGALVLATGDRRDEEVLEGLLRCSHCSQSVPIKAGVPDFTTPEENASVTAKAFGYQWLTHDAGRFEKERIYGQTTDQEFADLRRFLEIEDDEARGELLEVGCGVGRLLGTVAKLCPKMRVIGVDVSDSVFVAHRRSRGLSNLHIVRASVFALPFPAGSFDYVWSEGVLHSTPDTRAAFQQLPRLLRENGRIYIWLYPTTFHPYRLARDVLVKPYRIPAPLLALVCRAIAVPLFAAMKTWDLIRGGRRDRRYGEVVLGLFDNLSPEYQSRHTAEGVRRWFDDAGLVDVTAWKPALGMSGRKPGRIGGSRSRPEAPINAAGGS